jgi:hypothetical protein
MKKIKSRSAILSVLLAILMLMPSTAFAMSKQDVPEGYAYAWVTPGATAEQFQMHIVGHFAGATQTFLRGYAIGIAGSEDGDSITGAALYFNTVANPATFADGRFSWVSGSMPMPGLPYIPQGGHATIAFLDAAFFEDFAYITLRLIEEPEEPTRILSLTANPVNWVVDAGYDPDGLIRTVTITNTGNSNILASDWELVVAGANRDNFVVYDGDGNEVTGGTISGVALNAAIDTTPAQSVTFGVRPIAGLPEDSSHTITFQINSINTTDPDRNGLTAPVAPLSLTFRVEEGEPPDNTLVLHRPGADAGGNAWTSPRVTGNFGTGFSRYTVTRENGVAITGGYLVVHFSMNGANSISVFPVGSTGATVLVPTGAEITAIGLFTEIPALLTGNAAHSSDTEYFWLLELD